MSLPEANPVGATDISGAASRLKSMLLSEPEQPTDKQEESSAEKSVQEPQGNKQDTSTDDTPANNRRVKAKLGDREVEFDVLTEDIDLDLIPKGLMMEHDYRKKTTEVSESRKAIESKQSELDAKFQEVAEYLQFEGENLESEEMMDLKEIDPGAYWEKVDGVKTKAEKLKTWREKRQSELDEKNTEMAKQEAEKLMSAIPEWLDNEVKTKEVQDIFESLKNTGFSDSELSSVSDHRILTMARKAMLFDRIQSQDIEGKRIKDAPRSSSPGSKRTEAPENRSRGQLKNTGRVRDAQAAIRDLIK